MSPLSIALLSLAMSTDAFAAAVGKGIALKRPHWREALRTGAIFGAIVGQTFDGTIAPMTTAMGIAGILCLISHRALVRRG